MKILFIACYSPMINNSASIETLMYLNNLCNIENNCVHLLTVDFPKNSIYYDEEILKLLDSKVKVHAIEGGKLFNKIMPKKSIGAKEDEKSSNTKSSGKIKLMRKIKNKIIFPDMYYNWSFKASKYGIELMNKEKFDVIFSMHEPPSSHLCALRIKKHFKEIPWVLYWSDPWLKDPSRENIGFIRKFIEGRQEKSVVLNGDRHIFVTEENKKDFMEKYKEEITLHSIFVPSHENSYIEGLKIWNKTSYRSRRYSEFPFMITFNYKGDIEIYPNYCQIQKIQNKFKIVSGALQQLEYCTMAKFFKVNLEGYYNNIKILEVCRSKSQKKYSAQEEIPEYLDTLKCKNMSKDQYRKLREEFKSRWDIKHAKKFTILGDKAFNEYINQFGYCILKSKNKDRQNVYSITKL